MKSQTRKINKRSGDGSEKRSEGVIHEILTTNYLPEI